MATAPEVVRELDGLRALARALVAGSADADDLVQDAAVIALEHPPDLDRPVRPWLAAVLRNRRRMDRRASLRREARERVAAPDEAVEPRTEDAIDRARALERVSAALVALDEPFRTAVVRRYLDGESAADIARALGVPGATVRWRIKTGLERLRATLDDSSPRWRRALIPLVPFGKGALLVKLEIKIAIVVAVLLLASGGLWFGLHGHPNAGESPPPAAQTHPRPFVIAPLPPPSQGANAPVVDPLPGQGRVKLAAEAAAGGVLGGRVINWSTGEGVAGAELTFTGDAGAVTVRSRDEGVFELAPPTPGDFTLATIAAPGFLPYAPELAHSTIHVALAKQQAVRGLTVFLFPAVDYHGLVIDAAGTPVAGARVKLLGTPTGEQTIDKLATEWITAKDGTFEFHAADDAVFEATRGKQRGWAHLDGSVAITRHLTIKVGDAAPRDATITGKVVDDEGHPLPEVLVTALPFEPERNTAARATAFATSAADGRFTIDHVDRGGYELVGEIEGHAAAHTRVDGGTTGVTLTVSAGVLVAGTVTSSTDEPIPAFTITVFRREGAARRFELARSIVDPRGRFEVHVMPGDVELVASASGWAPNEPAHVAAKAAVKDVKLVLAAGGTLRGTVVDAKDHAPLAYARVMREARGGGASAQPANAGTVTRGDGTFELTGIPPGPVAITIGAGNYHPKIEGGMTARDGETIGPITIGLDKLAPGEEPRLELVGIGVALSADGDALRVDRVIPGGGAAAAGIVVGDHLVAIDGISATELGVDGAVARIRGAAGTTVALTLERGGKLVPLVVERRALKA